MNSKLTVLPQYLAVIALGLMAGHFMAYQTDVLPALLPLSASEFIAVQHGLNQGASNVGFTVLFIAATLTPFASAALAAWSSQRRMAMFWLLVALLHFLGVYWVSMVNVLPIQQEIMNWMPNAVPTDWQSERATLFTGHGIRTVAECICFIAAFGLTLNRKQLAVSDFRSNR